jgi:hypothetical protein
MFVQDIFLYLIVTRHKLTVQASVPPYPLVPGKGHTRLRERGWWGPNSNARIYTVVLYVNIVLCDD